MRPSSTGILPLKLFAERFLLKQIYSMNHLPILILLVLQTTYKYVKLSRSWKPRGIDPLRWFPCTLLEEEK